jgi:hypothetical protein
VQQDSGLSFPSAEFFFLGSVFQQFIVRTKTLMAVAELDILQDVACGSSSQQCGTENSQ